MVDHVGGYSGDSRRAKRWGSICRKIDWTGVTFALVLLTTRSTPRSCDRLILDGRDGRESGILENFSTPILSSSNVDFAIEAKSKRNRSTTGDSLRK